MIVATINGPVGRHQYDLRLLDVMNNKFAKVSHQLHTSMLGFLTHYGPGKFSDSSHDALNTIIYQRHILPNVSPSLPALVVASNLQLHRGYFDSRFLRRCNCRVNHLLDSQGP